MEAKSGYGQAAEAAEAAAKKAQATAGTWPPKQCIARASRTCTLAQTKRWSSSLQSLGATLLRVVFGLKTSQRRRSRRAAELPFQPSRRDSKGLLGGRALTGMGLRLR